MTFYLDLGHMDYWPVPSTLCAGAGPGFLDRGVIFTKGGGLICYFYLIIYHFFPNFLKILHENKIILSQRGVSSKSPEHPLDPPLM